MAFQRTVPVSVAQLAEYLEKVHQNRSHIKTVQVSEVNGHLEIDLDGKANFFGYPDVYIPIKKESIGPARALIAQIVARSAGGARPSNDDAQSLFEMIDPQGK